jgi:2-polyprenyl-6-methoxyphenol hydroxylase-like FAD-dependent oxidoreductase
MQLMMNTTTIRSRTLADLVADQILRDRVGQNRIDLLGEETFRLLPRQSSVVLRTRELLDRRAIDAEQLVGADAIEEIVRARARLHRVRRRL